jgi:hypothetical protein
MRKASEASEVLVAGRVYGAGRAKRGPAPRLALVFLVACAVPPPARPTAAKADAPTGRLAGAPATLRPGVVSYPDVPAIKAAPPMHHHHHGS